MDYEAINAYLAQMPFTALYDELSSDDKVKHVFNAQEVLKAHYRASLLSERAVALQLLYMLEGEEEEYAKLRRQGVSSFSTNRVTASIGGSEIAPEVRSLLKSKGRVGRLQ
ncbi:MULTISPECIES: hypothetical protein [Bacillaceae]|uniref:Uncharacterized protein n=1 Tax=Alkalicoccobacillus plakortidis TaxID=444060 RepID=A0A9D5DN97_9BACI|nr:MULTISPECIES: hypothetical protein [Bacillaceae]KQL57233.1 hypothetical protein AN965_09785 [Alkalicoccobacillus plakortidis]